MADRHKGRRESNPFRVTETQNISCKAGPVVLSSIEGSQHAVARTALIQL